MQSLIEDGTSYLPCNGALRVGQSQAEAPPGLAAMLPDSDGRGHSGSTARVRIEDLKPGSSPRHVGIDHDHALAMSSASGELPPILVHRPTMTVIDGHHRVVALKLRRERTIEVIFFEGSAQEAFVEAVRSNVAHGRPLTLGERESSARRIVAMFPDWSDRAIAQSCGLSPKTIAAIRRRATEEIPQPRARVGRDGRARPTDPRTARLTVAELLQQQPNASLREIARTAGTSVSTVRDVKSRVAQGDSPLPQSRSVVAGTPENAVSADAALRLSEDTACCSTEPGARFAIWYDSVAIKEEDWLPLIDQLPLTRIYVIGSEARARAAAWEHMANVLEQMVRERVREASRRSAAVDGTPA